MNDIPLRRFRGLFMDRQATAGDSRRCTNVSGCSSLESLEAEKELLKVPK